LLSFTRKVDYAVVALGRLAEQADADGGPMSARQIAAEYGLPLPLLMNLLKDLQKSGIISSTRGARGGYFLTEAPKKVSIMQVIESVEGSPELTPCCGDNFGLATGERSCRMAGACPMSASMKRLHGKFIEMLNHVTLQDMIEGDVDAAVSQATAAG
jgi:Rrf2 family protein